MIIGDQELFDKCISWGVTTGFILGGLATVVWFPLATKIGFNYWGMVGLPIMPTSMYAASIFFLSVYTGFIGLIAGFVAYILIRNIRK